MLSVAMAATPPTAGSVVLAARVAPGIPVTGEMATVTLAAKSETGFPPASSAVPCTAGVIVLPAVVLVGFTENDSFVAGPSEISKGVLVAAATPGAVAVRVCSEPRPAGRGGWTGGTPDE